MAVNNFPQTYGPSFAGGVFQVASQFVGQALINSIRKQFPKQKTKRGDAYMRGARYLLQTSLDLDLIEPDERPKIGVLYERATGARENLSTFNDSKIQAFLHARMYKAQCKDLFLVVQLASDRGMDKSLLEQIGHAMGGAGSVPPYTPNDPPSQPLTGTSVNSLNEVEMTTFRSEITGDVAVALTLRGKDGNDAITQNVITTFPPEVLTDYNADDKGPSITLAPIDESSISGSHAEADDER